MTRGAESDERDSARAWLRVAAAFLAGAVSFGVLYSFGVFLKPIAREFHANVVEASAFFSLTAIVYYLFGAFAGRLSDLFGPRLIVACGAAAVGLGLFFTAFAHRLWFGYLAYASGVGVGGACVYVPTLAAVGGWFVKRRNAALGIATAGNGIGSIAFPPLAAALIGRLGWRATDLVFAFLAPALLFVCAFLVGPPMAARAEGGARPLVRDLFTSREFVILYLSWVMVSSALFETIVFLPSFARAHGTGRIAAAALVSTIGGSGVAGRLAFGPAGDRLEALALFKLTCLIMALSYAIWLFLPSYGWLLVFAVIFGISYGTRFAALPAVLIDYFGIPGLGTTLGLFLTASGLAALIGPMLAGLAIDLEGGFKGAVLFAFAMGLLGFVALLPLRGRRGRERDPLR